MTYEMQYLMHLYSCGATGREAMSPTQPLDWEKVVTLAVEQSITYTVALPIKMYDLGCPAHIKERMTASLRGAALKNSIKTDAVLDLIEKMVRSGIPTLLIKGTDVARCYKNPECRVSADTDLLIQPENEERAVKLFESEGFTMKDRPETSNHAVGTHPTIGTVELHIQLISNEFKNVLQKDWTVEDNAFRTCVKTEYNGRAYSTLEPTDNLIYLTYHMIKHFLYGGVSLRMMMDNALYAKTHLDKIDVARYESMLNASKFLYFMQAIFGIMVKYCGFDGADFPIKPITEDKDMLAILDDLESGGWQGQKAEMDGITAWYCYRYNEAVSTENKSELSNLRARRFAELKKTVFPSVDSMAESYPVVRERRYLYPYYLVHRLFLKGFEYLRGGKQIYHSIEKDESRLTEGAKERIELFKELKIM